MNKIYAGIGSRDAPPDVLASMIRIGAFFAQKGYTLRSGAAEGSDNAFEEGCDSVKGTKEIFLPWKRYNDSNSNLLWTKAGWDLSSQFHPSWDTLGLNAKIFHARNAHIVMGLNLDTPVDFIICWTPDGKAEGGTSQAMRIASKKKIPIYNLAVESDVTKLRAFCKKLNKKNASSKKNSKKERESTSKT